MANIQALPGANVKNVANDGTDEEPHRYTVWAIPHWVGERIALTCQEWSKAGRMFRIEAIKVDSRPGKVGITALGAEEYLPAWTIPIMWRALPEFIHDNGATILDLEVFAPASFASKACLLP